MRKLRLSELNRTDVASYKAQSKFPVVVVLDNIRSALNIGSFFRTVDAFAFQTIHLCGICAIPPHKEIEKTAIGATESVEWEYFDRAIDSLAQLKNKGYKIIGIEQTDQSLSLEQYDFSVAGEKLALVFGNEVKGIDNALLPLLDVALEVPQYGTKHSLNVSVCGGIVLWKVLEAHLKLSTIAS